MSVEFNKEYELGDFAYFSNEKISAEEVSQEEYISTENMVVDRGGVEKASKLPSVSKFNSFQKTDTLFSNIRTYFRKVWMASFDGGASADVLVFRTKDASVLDPAYLYYLISNKDFADYSVLTAKGVKMPRGDKTAMMQYKFLLPDPEKQLQYASALKSLDDKIENNRRMNETLEGMAQAIFKSWFVDFDPVHAKVESLKNGGSEDDARIAAMCTISGKSADALALLKSENPNDYAGLATTADAFPSAFTDSDLGKIPEGWEVRSIYEISDVIYGAPFKSKLFNTNKDGLPLVRIRDLKNESPGVFTPENHVKGYLIQNGDLVVGMDGEFRPYIWGGNSAWMNQRICCFKPKHKFSEGLIKGFISSQLDHYEKTATATTVIHLGKGDIDGFTYLKPNSNLLEKYCAISRPIFEQIVLNKVLAKSLAETRNALLPKLLSGEIDIMGISGE